MKKKEAKVRSTMELPKALAYLEDIVKSLRDRKINVMVGDESVVLSPNGLVRVDLEAAQKPDKESITLKISWRLDPVADEEPALRIDSSPAAAEATA